MSHKFFFVFLLLVIPHVNAQIKTIDISKGIETSSDTLFSSVLEQVIYFPDGKIKAKGNLKKNKKNGLWIYFDRNGKESYHVQYELDSIIYFNFLRHKNGKVIFKQND
jgi:antitoxin component YwqK of YwqJK toxin-antitoxin module